MATASDNTINAAPLQLVMQANGWAQPTGASWFTRCRQLNRMLHEQRDTHLLRVPALDDSEPTWYAGVAGTSLAAGIERMAIAHEALRDAIVAFPLDARIYVADVQNGLVRDEWCLYADAFEQRVEGWREDGRTCALLTGGGQLKIDVPNAAEVPVDIDTEAMTFRHASIALPAAGLVRWRDCGTVVGLITLTVVISLGLTWWQRTPATLEPLQRVAALVLQPTTPVRHTASAELASLAMLAAEHDPTLWRVHGATALTYDPGATTLVLHAALGAPVTTQAPPLPASPAVPPLAPFTQQTYQTLLGRHLASPAWQLTFGDPYPIGTQGELEQHVTVAIDPVDDTEIESVAPKLLDLSRRLIRLPITLHQANCTIDEGVFTACELKLSIRGASA